MLTGAKIHLSLSRLWQFIKKKKHQHENIPQKINEPTSPNFRERRMPSLVFICAGHTGPCVCVPPCVEIYGLDTSKHHPTKDIWTRFHFFLLWPGRKQIWMFESEESRKASFASCLRISSLILSLHGKSGQSQPFSWARTVICHYVSQASLSSEFWPQTHDLLKVTRGVDSWWLGALQGPLSGGDGKVVGANFSLTLRLKEALLQAPG